MNESPYVQVLLVEEDPDIISVVSVLLSDIKECQLRVCPPGRKAVEMLKSQSDGLVLFSHDQSGKDLGTLTELHQKFPSLYLIVSLPESKEELVRAYMKAGVSDCVYKDKNYVSSLMYAVKKALIRIAERESFALSSLSRADQFAMDENLPDAVFVLDLEGKFLHVNRAITTLLGYEPKNLVQRSFLELIGDEGKSLFEKYLAGLERDVHFRSSVSLRAGNGQEEGFEINCTLMEDSMIYGVIRREIPTESFSDLVEVVEEAVAKAVEESVPPKLGPYRIVTLLGAGAMGRVYKGFDEQLERPVAIKVISKTFASDKEYLERFHREARMLASITHPNIALIYYLGNLEGLPYFCMEYLPGGSMEDLLKQKGKLDLETAISYTMQVSLGLDEALKKGIIHLDIKPSNLMIAENDRVKIVDFGLARKSRDLESIHANIVGTPLYIAPEQIQGGILDHRCDIYSLGISFFRMLFGCFPFSGKTIQELFQNQLNQDMPALETLDPDVPEEIYKIILLMTSRDSAKRYSKYSEIIQDLERARRFSMRIGPVLEITQPAGATVLMRGLLYDRPFPEVLGDIVRKKLSGKLTLSWINLCKQIHFRKGRIIAVLSNQEGEGFIDLLLEQGQLSGKRARKLQGGSSDLFFQYSSGLKEISPAIHDKLSEDLNKLAWRILQGLSSLVVGEYIFEQGEFSGQLALEIPAGEPLVKCIREWTDLTVIRRRLHEGQCRIHLTSDFQELLRNIQIGPADTFLLFRFEKSILFHDLHNISGIPEDEFYRLIYLFSCSGIVSLQDVRDTQKVQRPKFLKQEKKKIAEKPVEPRKPELPKDAAADHIEEYQAQLGRRLLPVEDMGTYYYRCALQSFKNKNFWATVEYCKKALEQRKNADFFLLMGIAFATHPGFRHEAMDAYKNGLEMDPENPDIHRHMGDLYFSTGNYALAKAKYQHVLKLAPADPHAPRRLEEIARRKK